MNDMTISTGNAARLCAVTRDTILKWIKKGILEATRTPGGHYRVFKQSIKPYVADQAADTSNLLRTTLEPFKGSPPCWEYMSDEGVVNETCLECLVYRAKASRCFEMASVGEEGGFRGTFCKTSCQECRYYQAIQGRRNKNNILVITEDVNLIASLTKGLHNTPFLIRFTSSTYECSAIIENFKPGIVVVDFELHQVQIENLCESIAKDPRLPGAKLLAVTSSRMDRDSLKVCSRAVCASLDKPVDLVQLQSCVAMLEDKV